jgi:hypothetical protein
MENTPLYAQKVTILSRLIKESSLTLEEALILLKEEEIVETPTPSPWIPGTTTPWIQPYVTTSPSVFSVSSTGTGTISVTPFSANTCLNTTTASIEADLNN